MFMAILSLTPILKARPIAGKVNWLATGTPGFIKIEGTGECLKGDIAKNGTGIIHCHLDDFDTGINLRNKHMKEKYLGTGKYPDAVLRVNKAKDGAFEGLLTIKENSATVRGTYALDKELVSANFKINLEQYPSIGVPSYLGVSVANEIDVNVSAHLD